VCEEVLSSGAGIGCWIVVCFGSSKQQQQCFYNKSINEWNYKRAIQTLRLRPKGKENIKTRPPPPILTPHPDIPRSHTIAKIITSPIHTPAARIYPPPQKRSNTSPRPN
jgi:hypothetical protein